MSKTNMENFKKYFGEKINNRKFFFKNILKDFENYPRDNGLSAWYPKAKKERNKNG